MKRIFFLILLLPTMLFSQQIVTLDGSASTDPDGSIVLYTWSFVSGPASVVIANPSSSSSTTTVSIPYVAGDYKFQLVVTDNKGAVSPSSVMTVHVLPNPDHAPVIVPAPDQIITAPVTGTAQATLTCKATDQDGDKLGYLWKAILGPNVPIIQKPADSITIVTNLVAGLYKFEVTVTDAPGAVRKDTVQILVSVANQLPISNGGPDKTITLPISTVSIGLIDAPGLAVQWIKTKGPNATIEQPLQSVTNISGLVAGDYTFMKMVTDRNGLVGVDNVNVTVNKSCSWIQKLFHINGCRF